MAEVDVNIDINVENNSSWELNEITNNVIHLHQAVQREERQENRWAASMRRVTRSALSAARAVAHVAASVSAVAAATGPAVTGLLAMGKALAVAGKAGVHLLPLLAFVPSLIGGVALLVGTVKLVGPAFAKAFEPITRRFVDAEGNASKFTKRLQAAATRGVRPLAEEFTKLNMPAIEGGMMRIARQVSLIVRGTLQWLNTSRGMALIKTTTEGTAAAVELLQPKLKTLIINLGDLGTRAGGAGIKGLADVIGRVLDKLTAWAANTSVDDIKKALRDLSGYGIKIKQTFGALRDVGRWLVENEDKIKHFSDVAAAAAITIGIATGNIPAVIGGVFALIINHWSDLKSTFEGAKPWLSDVINRWKTDALRIKLAESIMRAVHAGIDAFRDMIKDIGPKWQEFVSRLKMAWEEWAPLITAWWNTGGKQAFQLAGAALGGFVLLLLDFATQAATVAIVVANAFKVMVRTVLDVLGWIIGAAAKAFGWMPGIGPKLRVAAAEFDAFKNAVNRALDGIETMKTIRINANVYVTGGGSVAGGVDQRTGNSRNAGLSALTSWQQAAAAFAGDAAGRNRTGGPTNVTASVQNTILLDGRPFRAYTDRTVMESERRTAWWQRVGTR